MNNKISYKRLFITTFTLLLVVVIVFAYFGYFMGQAFGDYGDQHYYFINNMRQNFFATGDWLPQFNMNLGLGQSMSTMIYHGYLNPYVMASYMFNNISTQMIMSLITIFTISISVTFSYMLLLKNKFHPNISLITAFLFGFAPFLIFHSHYHPMYIYYYPYAILNLYAIHHLVEKKHSGLLTLSFSLIFFLNFFFAPIVTIVNIYYFIVLIYQKAEKKPYIFLFVKSYLVSLLISMVILLPNFILFLNSPRVNATDTVKESFGLNLGFVFQITLNPYMAAMGSVLLCAIIYNLVVRRNKKMLVITLFILVLSLFSFINYFLNVFQYVNYKQLIYIMPLAMILVASFLNDNNKVKKMIVKIISSTLLIILLVVATVVVALVNIITTLYPEVLDIFQGRTLVDANYIYFILIAFILYIILQWFISHKNIKKANSKSIYILCTLIAVVSFFGFNWFVPKMEEVAYSEMQTTTVNARDYARETNEVTDIDSFTATFYASMTNGHYSQMMKTYLETEVYGNERRVNNDVFNNEIMRFIFSIDDNGEEVMPIVYSKENSEIYSSSDLSSTNQLLALLTADFSTTSTNTYTPPNIMFTQVEEGITGTNEEINQSIPIEYKEDGVLYISFDASNNLCDKGFICSISINEHKNDIYSYSKSLYSPNNNFTYLIDINSDTTSLNINATMGEWTLSNIKYSFIPSSEIEELKKSYTPVEEFVIDINNGYHFTTNLETDGYVMTTIPYDTGFSVYVDGVKVETEIVNNYFLGFQVPAGSHEIVITYIMPGFIIGVISTGIGCIMLGFILYLEYFKKHKNRQNMSTL